MTPTENTPPSPSRARFDALRAVIAAAVAAGSEPNPAWVAELQAISSARPEWLAPPSPPSPPPSPVPPPAAPPPAFLPRAAVPRAPGERVPITVDEDMERVIKSVLDVWAARYCVFQAGGRLFEIQTDSESLKAIRFLTVEPMLPRLLQVGPVRARVLASRECRFGVEKPTRDGTPTLASCLPPDWLGSAIVTRSALGDIPPVTGLAQAPTLRRDGALVWEKGYDASTGIYMAGDIQVSIPEAPTQTDARVAMDRILDLVSDFSFANDAGRSAWVAGLLSIADRKSVV